MEVVRQIIVVNTETPFPIGRLCAHACHASIASLLDQGRWIGNEFSIDTDDNFELRYWMKESFTKVVCKCWGDDALLELKKKAEEIGLPASIIKEDGYYTALAIGPGEIEKLSHFKDLPLL